MRVSDACRVALRVALIGAVGWAVAGGRAQAAPTVLFSDTFQRSDQSSLGPDWMEAEAAATKFGILSGQALLNVTVGPSGGVDFAHAVTVPTFDLVGLGVQAETQEIQPIEGFTIRYGLGFTTIADDDLDLIFLSLQGQPLAGGGAAFEVFLTTPDPGGPGSVTYFLARSDPLAPPVNAFTRDTLTLSISPDAARVQALFNEGVLLSVPLDPADLPNQARVKIGNPGADMDTPGGPGRSGDVFYDNVVVTQAPAAVPEPPALLLLVCGLAGLAARRLRH